VSFGLEQDRPANTALTKENRRIGARPSPFFTAESARLVERCDIHGRRRRAMDANGMEMMILSLNAKRQRFRYPR
jgi:hypothetical protein